MEQQQRVTPAEPVAETGALHSGMPAGAILGGKYEEGGSRVLKSSVDLGWRSTIAAEIRRHEDLHCMPFVQPVNEVAIAISGSAKIKRRGEGSEQLFFSRVGAACVCPRGVPVKYLHIASGPLDMLHLYLPADLYESLECLDDTPVAAGLRYTGGFYDPLVQQIGVAIADALHTDSSTGRILLDSLGLALAARLLQKYTRPDTTKWTEAFKDAKGSKGLDSVRLNRVIDFMYQNLGADISLSDLAQVACLSVYHFARAFRQAIGSSPLQYISDLRISRAKELLDESNKTIEEIAHLTGFSSGANLARAFRKSAGVPPTQYRLANIRQ